METHGKLFVCSCALLAGLALAADAQQPAPPTASERLRVEVQVVNVYCTVKDKSGRLVTDLEARDFELREDGKRQTIRYFARETDRPVTLALLVDTSRSQERILPVEKETAARFLQQILRPEDLALLITFDVSVDLLQDFTSEAARLEQALERAQINAPTPLGPFPRSGAAGTRLYDAVYLAAREKIVGEVGRKAIVVLSDGVDTGSLKKFMEALEAAHRSEAMIYAIVVADPLWYYREGYFYPGYDELARLAQETGGRTVVVKKPEEMGPAFDAIAEELRSQYSLGYTPASPRLDGTFRRIEVKVKRSGLRVQGRRGYYAPLAPAAAR